SAGDYNDHSKIFLARTADQGATWSTPQLLFTNTSSDHSILAPTTVHMGGNQWLATWMMQDFAADASKLNQQLYTSRSINGGRTWSTPQLKLSAPVLKHRGTNFRLSMDADKNGTVIASALSQILRSSDYGETWTHIATPETSRTVVFIGPVKDYDVKSRIGYMGEGNWVNVFQRHGAANMDSRWIQIYY